MSSLSSGSTNSFLNSYNSSLLPMKGSIFVRLTSRPLDIPGLSSPRVRQGRRPVGLSLLNQYVPSAILSLVLLPSLKIFPTVSIPGSRHRSTTTTRDSTFLSTNQRAKKYLTDLRRAACSDESQSSFRSPLFPTEVLAAATNLSSSIASDQNKDG